MPVPIFLAVALAGLIMVSALSSHPVVCGSCHPMRQAAEELNFSIHMKVSCTACHRKSSVMAMPIQKFEQGRMVASYIIGNYKQPITTDVDNETCLKCHRGIRRGIKFRLNVMMSHNEVIKADVRCTECHEEIAHQKKKAQRDTSMMEKCSACHNGREASARCEKCHANKVWLGMKPAKSWGVEHGEDWMKVHGSRSLDICKACHKEKDCTKCHSSIPHREGWAFIHGQEAIKNRDDCTICHKHDSFCRQCHQINMPHPKSWSMTHQWQVEVSGQKVCDTCHHSRDCKACHDKHVHKGEPIRKKTE